MSTLLCVPIMVLDEHTAIADAAQARDAGADIVEFRIDQFFSGAKDTDGQLQGREVGTILRIIAASPLPCIVTCRSSAEGGHYDGEDAERISLYERLGTAGGAKSPAAGNAKSAEHPPRYIDLEYATYTRSANLRQKVDLAVDHPAQRRDVRTGLILSMHDFDGRPTDLLRRLSAMQNERAASVVKIAYHARSLRDNLELFDLLTEGAAGHPLIALAMGRFGLMSRVLARKFGGFLTFASLRDAAATAPGQPTVRELLDVYNFRSIRPSTRVYGLVGWPVEHSLGTLIHNAGFESLNPDSWELGETELDAPLAHDGVYLPLPVPPEYEHFKATLGALLEHPRLDFSGCSVTVPHKQHLVRFARERMAVGEESWRIDETSEMCGAGNTLVVERGREGGGGGTRAISCRVMNTDSSAAVGCLRDALGGAVAGKRVGLIGAGGAARAIAAGLVREGATVVVYGRSRERADALVNDLREAAVGGKGKIVAADLDAIEKTCCDAMVNCTPVGMRGGPAPNESPIPVERLRNCSPNAVVFDTVYNPLVTPLLEQAGLAGIRTLDGLGMFVRQAAEQFAAWTGHAAPLRLFEQICREALAARESGG